VHAHVDNFAPTTLYSHARQLVAEGDCILLRGGGLLGANSPTGHTHALLAWWKGDVLKVFESREFQGAHDVTLSSQVRKFPFLLDVYRPLCDVAVAQRATDWSARMSGHEYGYRDWALTLGRRFGLHGRERTDVTLGEFHEPRDCSAAVAWCYRKAQAEVSHELADLAPEAWDPAPGINEHFVEPYMLAGGSFRLVCRGLVHGATLRAYRPQH
jgi:hypothetical protein